MDSIERFGSLLTRQARSIVDGNRPMTVSLGNINGDLSLTIDGVGGDVPKGQYMVSRHLTLPEIVTSTTADGHSHDVKTELRPLKSGDRVLVIWAGAEPVVTDILLSS